MSFQLMGVSLAAIVVACSYFAAAVAGEPNYTLKGKKVAILVTDGFEQSELAEPRQALDAAGANTVVVSPNAKEVKAWNKSDWGEKVKVDVGLADAKADQFDALLLPGGVMNPDKLRRHSSMHGRLY
jgi:protease I